MADEGPVDVPLLVREALRPGESRAAVTARRILRPHRAVVRRQQDAVGVLAAGRRWLVFAACG
jgi:hypothetical protein